VNWPTIIAIIAAVAFVLWLVTDGLWRLLRLIGRKTGLDEKVDHAFDTEGELSASDRLKFQEQHRDSAHHRGFGGGLGL
jgi:hypothetical protein